MKGERKGCPLRFCQGIHAKGKCPIEPQSNNCRFPPSRVVGLWVKGRGWVYLFVLASQIAGPHTFAFVCTEFREGEQLLWKHSTAGKSRHILPGQAELFRAIWITLLGEMARKSFLDVFQGVTKQGYFLSPTALSMR